MNKRAPQTVVLDERGQTVQDYALGISIFLLTLFFVMGTIVPSVLAPFSSGVSGEEVSQADRVAQHVVTNSSVPGKSNRLNATQVETVVGLDTAALRDRYGLPETAFINVSLRTLDGSTVVTSADGVTLASPQRIEANDATTTARIVTLNDGSCTPACRLVVGVW